MTAFHLFNDKQYLYELFDQTRNVRAIFGKDSAGNVATYSYTDYYPFGMPLPGEQLDPNLYRYGYQGQFAEAEPETGNNFFDLRTWDSRLARWTAPDPYQQYFSPYIGMGNNPINSVDPDGGQNLGVIAENRPNSANSLNSVPSSPSQGGGAYYPEYPMNTSFAGVEDNNYPAPPSASAPEDELLNNSPNRDINSLPNPMSIPEIAPIESNQPYTTTNDAWYNDPFYQYTAQDLIPKEPELIEEPAPQPSEPFYMALANRKWLSQQRSMPRYNWEGMKARQNAEAARVNAEMGRNPASGGDDGIGRTVQAIALTANFADIAISTAEQTIQTTRIGANFAYAISGSGKLVNVVSNTIKYAPYVGLSVSVLTGYYLSTENNPATGSPYQSWGETGSDIGVNIATMYIGAKYGGWYGAGAAVFYIGVKTNVQYQMNNGLNPGMIFIMNKE